MEKIYSLRWMLNYFYKNFMWSFYSINRLAHKGWKPVTYKLNAKGNPCKMRIEVADLDSRPIHTEWVLSWNVVQSMNFSTLNPLSSILFTGLNAFCQGQEKKAIKKMDPVLAHGVNSLLITQPTSECPSSSLNRHPGGNVFQRDCRWFPEKLLEETSA